MCLRRFDARQTHPICLPHASGRTDCMFGFITLFMVAPTLYLSLSVLFGLTISQRIHWRRCVSVAAMLFNLKRHTHYTLSFVFFPVTLLKSASLASPTHLWWGFMHVPKRSQPRARIQMYTHSNVHTHRPHNGANYCYCHCAQSIAVYAVASSIIKVVQKHTHTRRPSATVAAHSAD